MHSNERRIQRLEQIRAEIRRASEIGPAKDAAMTAATALGPLGALFNAVYVYMRGEPGLKRMSEALEVVIPILKESSETLARLDEHEHQLMKLLELVARTDSREKIKAAQSYFLYSLRSDDDAVDRSINEEFERWLQSATTLEVRCVLALEYAPVRPPTGGAHHQLDAFPTTTTLPNLLGCNKDMASRTVRRLITDNLVQVVSQEAGTRPEHPKWANLNTDAYVLTGVGQSFRERMEIVAEV